MKGSKSIRAKATIVDVAKHAGVSIKTVSRVINREANVREATREKVLRAAEALDYQPNPSARGLAGSRSFSIGMLYNNPAEFGYVKDNLFGAFTATRESDYSLLLHPCEEQPDLDAVRRFIQQTGVDGLILAAPLCDDEGLLELLSELDVPFTQIAPAQTAQGASSVQCDDYDACYRLTEHVISLGHKRIAFIKGDPKHASGKRRLAGFRACLRDHGLDSDRSLVRQGYYDFESGCRCARDLLELPEPPSAILACNDDMAAGVLFTAHENGVRVPEELSVTGFDDTPTARHCWPPLTTARQPIIDMSHAAAAMLLKRVRGDAEPDGERVFECELMFRGSTGPA